MQTENLKFLADESLEYTIVLYLRNKNFDVLSVAEDYPSISDKEILAKAVSENRIVLTNDKDFGDLVFLHNLPHSGVLLFRFKNELTKNKIRVLDLLLNVYPDKLHNNFIVIDETKIRIRYL